MFIDKLNIISQEQKLEENFSVENTVVVCGAGISLDSELPLGSEIVKTIKDLISKNTFQNKIDIFDLFNEYNRQVISKIINWDTDLYRYPRLEAIFNSVRSVLTENDYYEFIKYVLYMKCINKPISSTYIHFELAEFIKEGGKVLTANFDELIEQALNENKITNFQKVVFPSKTFDFNIESGMLIKYHGDINIPNSIGIDLSRLSFKGFDDKTVEFLNKVFDKAQNILFIGFSVSDTLDLIPYLNTISDCRYFYLNFRNRPKSLQIEFWENTLTKGNEFEPFNFFCKKNGKNGFHIFEAYIEGSIFRKQKSKKSQILLDSTNIETIKIQKLFSNSEFSDRVYLSILINFGLLNLLSNHDKERLSYLKVAHSYLNNINGSYREELDKIKSVEGRTRFRNPNYFIKLQEYVFLSKGMFLKRIFKIPNLLLSWIVVRTSSDRKDFLHKSYSLNLLPLRVLQVLVKIKFPKWLIPKFTINKYLNQMEAQMVSCKEQNNLKLYRFSLKESWYVKCYFKDKLAICDEQLLSDLQVLVELNADSNYLLDINNILRNASLYISRNNWYDLSEKSCEIIGDKLNLEKLRNASQSSS